MGTAAMWFGPQSSRTHGPAQARAVPALTQTLEVMVDSYQRILVEMLLTGCSEKVCL